MDEGPDPLRKPSSLSRVSLQNCHQLLRVHEFTNGIGEALDAGFVLDQCDGTVLGAEGHWLAVNKVGAGPVRPRYR